MCPRRTIAVVSTLMNERVALEPNVKSFLTKPVRYATIATINPDGSPHQIVIWFLLRNDDRHGDHLVVNSRRGRRWPANLTRDGRANLAVYRAEDAVTIECRVASTYEGEAAQADIAEMARRYDSPEDAEREMARFRTEDRVTFVLQPTRVLAHGSPS
jgi:PPOX class probable F420-dependent enzyme